MPLARVIGRSGDLASFAAGADIVVLTEGWFAESKQEDADAIDSCRAMTIGFVTAALTTGGTAAALATDWLVAAEGARFRFAWDSAWGDSATGLLRRIGRKGVRLLLEDSETGVAEALRLGFVDGVVPAGSDPVKWLGSWLGTRSALALGSAATLLRSSGGDSLERAEFARLFAAGEPQRGLTAFLERVPPGFDQHLRVETI